MDGLTIKHDEDLERAYGKWVLVRRSLGVRSFGMNTVELPPGESIPEHDETGSGQEEVTIVVRGSGVYRVDGEDVEVKEGDFLRFDPETTRCPVAGPNGMTLIAVGSPPGAYEPRGPF